jgi:hypothetical protein
MRRGVFVGDYETASERVGLALMAGAALGAAIMCSSALFNDGLDAPSLNYFLELLQIGVFAFVVMLVGMGVVGAPIWRRLHRLHLRGWGAAVCAGVFGPFMWMSLFVIALDSWTRFTSIWLLEGAVYISFLFFPACGGAIGLTVWAVAYRRPKPLPWAEMSE